MPPTPEEVSNAFGVDVGALRPHRSGFEAEGFSDGRWFVKLWRDERPIDSDASLALTADLAASGVPVPGARRAMDGGFTAEHRQSGRRYALFPFAEGREGTWEDDAEAIARAMRALHDVSGVQAPRSEMDEWCIEVLRDRLDHPWIADRRDELLAGLDRLEAVIARGRATLDGRALVVCHHDLFPHNVIVDGRGEVTALLDWGHAMLAPREHDLFAALCGPDPVRFLDAYGAERLDATHLEYGRLARSLRDITARVHNEVDREGLETRELPLLRRVDADLALAAPYCRT